MKSSWNTEAQRSRSFFEFSTLFVPSVPLCFYSLNPFQKLFGKPLNEAPG
jgi:hypothetical protein